MTLALVTLACGASGPATTGVSTNDRIPSADRVDQGTLARLEAEAKALAKTEGCARGEQCNAAPVGAKACGGPRYYLPYCPLTTDGRALVAKLDELRKAEERYNRENGVVSTCELAAKPPLESVNGVCRARGR